MKLPIRNFLSTPLTLLIEPYALAYKVPPGGQAVITLDDGCSHSIDMHPDQGVSIWDGGSSGFAVVEISDEHQDCPPDRRAAMSAFHPFLPLA